MTGEAWVPLPPSEPDQRAGTIVGDYCPKCGRLVPCAWHPVKSLGCAPTVGLSDARYRNETTRMEG